MEGDYSEVSLEGIIGESARLKVEGYRLVTLSCLKEGDGFRIFYHFDKDLGMRHLGLKVEKGVPVPSISRVYLASFLSENEIQDLFGIRFTDLAVDYGRTLYLHGEQTPPPYGVNSSAN